MTGLPAAGWYPVTPDALDLRWWDGSAWTEHVQDRAVVASAEPSTPTPLTRRELRAQVGPLTVTPADESQHSAVAVLERETEPAIEPTLSSGDQLRVAGGFSPAIVADVDPALRTWKYIPYRASSQTVQVWLIALSPIGSAAIALPLQLLMPQNVLLSFGVSLTVFVLLLLAARADALKLQARELPQTSPWWLLLGFVYFVIRAVRVGVGGVGPLVAFVAAEVASVVLVFFVLFTVMGVPLSAVAH